VIHRDIKPENILLHDGRPMVADFGIALAVSAAAGGRMTETGMSLGTPQYMSPEQATAERELDGRSDEYSLACVLYEMLAGEPPFTAPTAQAVVAKILAATPDPVTTRRPTVPAHIEAALYKGLEKLPADRFSTTGVFAKALTDPRLTVGLVNGGGRWIGGRISLATAWHLLGARLGAVGLALVAVTATLVWVLKPTREPIGQAHSTPTRFTIPVPTGFELGAGQVPRLTLSPSGRTLVYGTDGALYKRNLNEFESERLDGTDGAYLPFFSQDGEWIGFWLGGFGGARLRISVDGGPVSEIPADIDPTAWGVHWGSDGSVAYAAATGYAGIHRSMAGEAAEPLTVVLDSTGESSHQWPQLLDGGTAVLFSAIGPSWLSADSRVIVQDIESGRRTIVVSGATFGRYVPRGRVTYVNAEGTLHAIPFDLERRAVTGEPRPVESGIRTAYWGGAAAYAVSAGGTLAFARGSEFERHLLVWIDRAGRRSDPLGPPLTFETHNLSPDGRRVAMDVSRPNNSDISVTSASSWQPRRFTLEQAQNESPVWSPDGGRLAYTSAGTGGATRIWIRDPEAGSEPFLVYTAQYWLELRSWSSDGSWLAFTAQPPGRQGDAYAVRTDGSGQTIEISATGFGESGGRFSPEDRWVAYASNETGSWEVYAVSFPGIAAKQQVSNGGGARPRWSRDGGELFFLKGDTLMVVSVDPGRTLTVGSPRPLFAIPDLDSGYGYNVSPDADRFLVRVRNPDALSKKIHVVTNWVEELETKVRN
jgi:serine/threonine-protein kinase